MAGWLAAAQGISDIGSTVASAVMQKHIMKWMEKMRATAYQTQVKDLSAAGLNPALAFGGGHAALAPTPSVSNPFANLPGKFDVVGAVGQAVSTARQMKTTQDQVDTIRFGKERSEAEASSAWSEAENATTRLRNENSLMMSQAVRNFEEAKLAVSENELTNARTKATSEQEISTRVNRMLSETDLPGARARERFDETEHGQVLREVRRFLDALPGVRGSFSTGPRWNRRSGSGGVSP